MAPQPGAAAIRIAADMFREGLVTKDQAIMLVEPEHLDQMLHDQIDPAAEKMASLARYIEAHVDTPLPLAHLAEIAGLAEVTLQPCAGAHGEMTGVMIITPCASTHIG